jgi:hypothetical protein
MVLGDTILALGTNLAGVSAITAGNNVENANLDLNAKGGGAVRVPCEFQLLLAGGLRKVEVGGPDSGGPGYRMLRVIN